MSKVIQIRDVPEDVHAALTRASTSRGLTLTRYLLRELEQVAQREQAVERNAEVIRTLQERIGSHPDRDSILAVLDEGRGGA